MTQPDENFSPERRAQIATRVTLWGMILNIVLSAGKLVAGIVGNSAAMVADAVHSTSDFATDIAVLVFVRLSGKPKDADHDYGHGKYETLGTVLIGILLLVVAAGILFHGGEEIYSYLDGEILPRPGFIAIAAAILSILLKEFLYWYTLLNGRRISSPALIANAWHHRSDALSSIGTLLGIGGAYFLGEKWRILDPVAAIIVGIIIIKIGIDLVRPGLNELLEKSLPEEVEKQIMEIIAEEPEIKFPHHLQTRQIGPYKAIEIHVRLKDDMTVAASHAITENVERRLRETFGRNTHVSIHVEPVSLASRSGGPRGT